MWNGTFFERSDLLTHELTIDLCHFLDDCHSIPLNLETHTIFYPDSPDDLRMDIFQMGISLQGLLDRRRIRDHVPN